MSEPKDWTVRKLIIHLDNEQMIKAVCHGAGIELGDNEGYIREIKFDDDGYWEIDFAGQG